MTSDARRLQALLRNDFRAFSRKVFATLAPGQKFFDSWHLSAIADRLERVRIGKCKRVITNMPPRSLKSIMASVSACLHVGARSDAKDHLRELLGRPR